MVAKKEEVVVVDVVVVIEGVVVGLSEMTSIPVYCLCQSPYDANHFMIECDLCQQWFHGSCVGVEEEKAIDIDVYHCPKCEILHGPSIMKKCRRTQAQKLIGKKAAGKTGQTGSPEFTQERRQRRVNSTKKVSDLPRPRNSKAKRGYKPRPKSPQPSA
ncbi:histone lysine demethylase PHF8-like [Sarcophilus harrisii]|uniref:histone lysine demethylase PHF8-like n=1 Tax=Sarcophilus harrisii TaxID=9305 RepID=UPI001301CC2F|nr:histone lysine demethylase PHF8-like [Sarcophilus harrisii]